MKEAAIKWQRGNLFKDLSEWETDEYGQNAFHRSLNSKVNLHLIDYNSWLIAIAYNQNIDLNQAILCIN